MLSFPQHIQRTQPRTLAPIRKQYVHYTQMNDEAQNTRTASPNLLTVAEDVDLLFRRRTRRKRTKTRTEGLQTVFARTELSNAAAGAAAFSSLGSC